MGRCTGLQNGLLMMRTRGLGGPMFQHIGPGLCAHAAGARLEATAQQQGHNQNQNQAHGVTFHGEPVTDHGEVVTDA